MTWRDEAETAAKQSKDKVLATFMQGALAELTQQNATIQELREQVNQLFQVPQVEDPNPILQDKLAATEKRLLEVREAIRFALRNPTVLAPVVLVKLRQAVQEP